MRYYCVTFHIEPFSEALADVLSEEIAAIGFDSFAYTDKGVQGFIPCTLLDTDKVDLCLAGFPIEGIEIGYRVEAVPDENWNATWEQEGFRPIRIGDNIHIHDTRTPALQEVPYDIVINASMTFGTGSHETTGMILKLIEQLPIQGKRVIDAGTGTGILAILCRMKGASSVLAYDIDERSVANTLDNMALNHCTAINVKLGDSRILEDEAADYDLLIANINRNILLHDMPLFRRTLKRGGRMLLSGFYLQDADAICHSAEELGLHPVKQDSHNQWTAILFETDAAGGMDV